MSDQADPAVSDATEQSATPPAKVSPAFSKSVIQAMSEGEDLTPEAIEPEEEQTQEATPPEREEAPETEEAEVPAGPKIEPASDKDKSAEAVPGEWPQSARLRVAEEADKRRRATQRATEAEAKLVEQETKITDLMSQLGSVSRPILPENPLSDVHDEASLRKAEKQYEKLLEFAERNRGGAWDVTTGRNPDGSPKKEDFDEQQITEMKLDAEKALRTLIPQRRNYLTQRTQMDSAARQIYSALEDPQSQWSQEAAAILRIVPELERVPDVLVWIGHALHRRDEFVASLAKDNGQIAVNDDAKRIVENAKAKSAPSVPADRGFARTRDADVETARKRMKTEGSEEATEDFIGSVLERGRRRRMGSQPVR